MRTRLRRLGAMLFVVAAFLFLTLAVVRQRAELVAFDWQIAPASLVLSTVLLVAVLAWGIWIWVRILRAFDLEVPFPTLARIWFLSSLGRYIPGKVWQFVGVAELSRAAGVSALLGITSLLVYMGFVVLSAFLVGLYLIPTDAMGPVAGAAPILRLLAPASLLTLHPRILGGLVALGSRVLRKPLAPWSGTWAAAIGLLGACLLQWGGFGLAFSLFVASLTASISLADVSVLTAAFALAFLAGYLAFFAPAGFGAKEGALAVLLAAVLPIPFAVAAALAVATRVWSIVADVIPALFFLRRARAHFVDPCSAPVP